MPSPGFLHGSIPLFPASCSCTPLAKNAQNLVGNGVKDDGECGVRGDACKTRDDGLTSLRFHMLKGEGAYTRIALEERSTFRQRESKAIQWRITC